MIRESTPAAFAHPNDDETPSPAPWSWWLIGLVVLGALLTAAGGLLALHPTGQHLNTAGRDYADYFLTRNLGMATMLLLTLALRARRALTALMLLTATIQSLDAVAAASTGRVALIPIDLAFTAVFLFGASHLSTRPLWRAACWRD